jgi:hypothetical protein
MNIPNQSVLDDLVWGSYIAKSSCVPLPQADALYAINYAKKYENHFFWHEKARLEYSVSFHEPAEYDYWIKIDKVNGIASVSKKLLRFVKKNLVKEKGIYACNMYVGDANYRVETDGQPILSNLFNYENGVLTRY